MPYQVTAEPAFLRITFSGRMGAQDLQAAMRELETLEAAAARIPHRLIDLTAIEHSEVKADDIHAAAAKRKSRRFANPFRSAIVAPRAAQFGYARMFQMLNDHPDITIQIFATLAEATSWLTAKTEGDPGGRLTRQG